MKGLKVEGGSPMKNYVLFYTSPGCASCRKAKRWLEDNRIDFVEKNIFSNLLSEAEIKFLLSRCENGTQDIISTRSKAYAALKTDLDSMSVQQLIRFIQKNPSVLKRPIMLSEHNMVIGYDDDEITAMIPVERRRTHIIIEPSAVGTVELSLRK
jgi:regulatory protein spx